MKTYLSLAVVLIMALAPTAHAAIYMKFDGVDGEVKATTNTHTSVSTAYVGKPFVLDGTKSIDDATIRTFSWEQVSGPTVTLGKTASLSVVPPQAGTYVFELIVTDANGRSSVAEKRTFTVDATGPIVNLVNTIDVKVDTGGQIGDPDFDLKTVGPVPTVPAVRKVDGGTIKGEIRNMDDDGDSVEDRAARNNNLQGAADVTSDLGMKGGVSVAAGDINGLTAEEKQAFLLTVKSHAQVKSEQDLANFAKGVLLNDDAIRGISIKENIVEVESEERAKLFGLFSIPFKMVIVADLNSDGASDRIKVKLPWWHVFASKEIDASDFADTIDSALNLTEDGITAKGSGKIESIGIKQSVDVHAEALLIISNMLKNAHDSAKSIIQNIRA